MKKTLALFLALALCLSLCACGQAKTENAPGRSDGSGGVISKPGEAPAAEQPAGQTADGSGEAAPDRSKEPDAPAQTAEPSPDSGAIAVKDLCSVSGILSDDSGYSSAFSYTLPEVSGPDTAYLRALNEEMAGLYDSYVCDALEAMEEDLSLMCYCISYYYGCSGGVHSILVTCDSDWGMDEYRCFNFDDAGNEVNNASVLEAAGLTPERFVSLARAYLEHRTDLSEYGMEEEAWKELQDKTLAEDNCNAEMPMCILPGGGLCFIATVYTLAGAGQYDCALEIDADGEVSDADVGRIMLTQLQGTYLLAEEAPEGDDWHASTFYDLFMVGDTLTMEVTGFDPESSSVYYYYGADIFPEDPAALLRTDGAGVRVRVVQHCPDVFGGSYYGEAGIYTLYATQWGIAFTDFEGGTPLVGDGEDVCALTAYRGDLGLADPTEKYFGEYFDYDAVEASGLAGIWSGVYRDEDYNTHSVTLELTNWGRLRLRDCVGAEIPRVLDGEYYIAGADDQMAPEGAVVFALAARNGYKMPNIGYTWMELDYDDTLIVTEDTEGGAYPLLRTDPEYAAVLTRVPYVRYAGASEVIEMEDQGLVRVDLDADGTQEEIGVSYVSTEEDDDVIVAFVFTLDGEEIWLEDMYLTNVRSWLMVPALSGAAYLYIEGEGDNGYHNTTVIGFGADGLWYAGDYMGGFGEDPVSVEEFSVETSFALLGTALGAQTCRLGLNGLPEAVDPYYRITLGNDLTSRLDIDCWTVDAAGGTLESATLPAGTRVKLLRSDGATFTDLEAPDGTVYRVWVSGWPREINGVPVADCFDGVVFAA